MHEKLQQNNKLTTSCIRADERGSPLLYQPRSQVYVRAAERQVQSAKENSRYNMCLTYLRLLLDKLCFCVPVRAAIIIKKNKLHPNNSIYRQTVKSCLVVSKLCQHIPHLHQQFLRKNKNYVEP